MVAPYFVGRASAFGLGGGWLDPQLGLSVFVFFLLVIAALLLGAQY